MASLCGRLRATATIGVEQNSPESMPLTPKRAVVDATAMSQLATSWQPAAVAVPPTSAANTRGERRIAVMSRVQVAKSSS
jgi:hypothetical protein